MGKLSSVHSGSSIVDELAGRGATVEIVPPEPRSTRSLMVTCPKVLENPSRTRTAVARTKREANRIIARVATRRTPYHNRRASRQCLFCVYRTSFPARGTRFCLVDKGVPGGGMVARSPDETKLKPGLRRRSTTPREASRSALSGFTAASPRLRRDPTILDH